jgi:hypothetical protein
MHRSINQIIFFVFCLFNTILTAEANSINANSVTATTLPPGSLINNQVKTNNRNMVIVTTTIDVSSCEALYGPCNCKSGNTKCCTADQCAAITTTTTTESTTPHIYFDTCEMLYGPCDCKSGNTKCCAYDQCTQITGTPIFTVKNNKCHRK